MSNPEESDVHHRQLDHDAEEPAVAVAEAVADLRGVEVTELSSTYDCLNGILDHLFSNPPKETAEIEISFNYEGYHISVRQDGSADFVDME